MKNLREYKILGVVIMVSIGLTLAGCGINKSNKSEGKDYKEYALETLQQRYGEEFEIKQIGGTFEAYANTKKLICNPVTDKDQFIFVQVEPDLSEVHDNYINKIMSDKLLLDINANAKEIFGENIKIKIEIDGLYNKYESIDMNVVEFLNENSGRGYVITIFVKSEKPIDKTIEADKLDRFTKYILNTEVSNDCRIVPWYVGEGEYNVVDSIYNKLEFENKKYDYYRSSKELYGQGYSSIEKQKQMYNRDQLIDEFKLYN